MQLRAEGLDAHLAKTLAPVYAVHGDEPLLALEAADAVRAAARKRVFR
jgi:DNA polymerase-3 subunit delta